MSEPELVRGCERGTPGDRDLAGRLQHRAAAQLVGVPHAGRICGGQWLWKRRWLRHLGKRFAFPTFPQPRRRRPYFDLCSETENPGSFVMTGPKTGGRSSSNWRSLSLVWLSARRNCTRNRASALLNPHNRGFGLIGCGGAGSSSLEQKI